jgi:hypothetical protein
MQEMYVAMMNDSKQEALDRYNFLLATKNKWERKVTSQAEQQEEAHVLSAAEPTAPTSEELPATEAITVQKHETALLTECKLLNEGAHGGRRKNNHNKLKNNDKQHVCGRLLSLRSNKSEKRKRENDELPSPKKSKSSDEVEFICQHSNAIDVPNEVKNTTYNYSSILFGIERSNFDFKNTKEFKSAKLPVNDYFASQNLHELEVASDGNCLF